MIKNLKEKPGVVSVEVKPLASSGEEAPVPPNEGVVLAGVAHPGRRPEEQQAVQRLSQSHHRLRLRTLLQGA